MSWYSTSMQQAFPLAATCITALPHLQVRFYGIHLIPIPCPEMAGLTQRASTSVQTTLFMSARGHLKRQTISFAWVCRIPTVCFHYVFWDVFMSNLYLTSAFRCKESAERLHWNKLSPFHFVLIAYHFNSEDLRLSWLSLCISLTLSLGTYLTGYFQPWQSTIK